MSKTVIPLEPLYTITTTKTTGFLWWKKTHVSKHYLLQNVWYDMNTDDAAPTDVQNKLSNIADKLNNMSVALGLDKFEK